MSFPLFHRPGAVVFLDDDPDYLEMLALVMPRHWQVRLYLRQARCLFDLHREPPLWEIDAWAQQVIVDEWRQGKPLVPQLLDYWGSNEGRHGFTQVCVVDFSMPGMNGLQVLGELHEWQGSRVLLTGQADEQIAVAAFNEGLIHQFIPKQTPDISRRLIAAVERMLATPAPRLAQVWRATLNPAQHALLQRPAVQAALAAFAAGQWVEYMAIGDPFGILGLDGAGRASWLQLETRDGLAALAEVAELSGMARSSLAGIREGRMLVHPELRASLGLQGPGEPQPAFAPGDDADLLAAHFDLHPVARGRPPAGYDAWRARQPGRAVIE